MVDHRVGGRIGGKARIAQRGLHVVGHGAVGEHDRWGAIDGLQREAPVAAHDGGRREALVGSVWELLTVRVADIADAGRGTSEAQRIFAR